jgi:trigger factor
MKRDCGFLFQYFKTGINNDRFRRRIIRTTPASPSPVKTMMDGSVTVVMAKLQLTSVLCPPGDTSDRNNSHCPFGFVPIKLVSIAAWTTPRNADGADCGLMFTPSGWGLSLLRHQNRLTEPERFSYAARLVTRKFIVNVTVENLAPCKKLLRVELDAKAVDEVFETITKDFQKQAALPGFRPGKAPRALVLKKYEADIKNEVKRKLIGDHYRKALEEKKIAVIGYPDIEEIQFGRGQNLQFAATIETAPEFQLPEYKGLVAKREIKSVTDADVERAVGLLAQQHMKFETVARELKPGDIAVVNYTGACDGKPITDTAPTAKGLTEQKNFWVDAAPNTFIPGFADQLVGAKAGDKRTVNVDFPADFVTKELAGKKGVFEVEIVEVKEKVPPAVDDAFAKKYDAENLEKLRAGVRRDLENELKYSQARAIRGQIVRGLLDRVVFELPESAVAHETRNVVYDLVRQNSQRGVKREMIEKQKDEIYAAATHNAKERVKLAFLIQRIAEQEKISVSQEEVVKHAQSLAAMYQMPFEQFLKDLQKRNGVNELYDQIAHEKVLTFLEQNAKIEDVPPAAG